MKDGTSYFLNPALVTMVLMSALVIIVLVMAGGDPLALARLGSYFYEQNPDGSQGYDGQFVYYIAINPQPEGVAPYLDVPAYRYQRILFPAIARAVSLGNVTAIPWALPFLGILFQTVGTLFLSELLAGWGISRWYALVYGLWVGFGLAIRLDLPEPLAYALVIGAILVQERRRKVLSWILYGLALFAKEVTVLFVMAAFLSYIFEKRWRAALGIGLVAGLPFLIFQVWLWQTFGEFGIGSGGAMATSFEIIPFLGLLRIGSYSMVYLLAMAIVFVPAIVIPVLWGLWATLQKLRDQQFNVVVLALLLNAIVIMFLPFSTFRETGGLLRFACGLVLAVILFAARYTVRRALNYSWFWLSFNVFLFKTGGLL